LLTALGTLPVLLFRQAPRRLMDAMMGFAGGVMTAAACWSLLVPAIDTGGVTAAVVGLLAGAGFISIADQLLPHLHSEFPDEAKAEVRGESVNQRAIAEETLAVTGPGRNPPGAGDHAADFRIETLVVVRSLAFGKPRSPVESRCHDSRFGEDRTVAFGRRRSFLRHRRSGNTPNRSSSAAGATL
jgi:hypothetical protein